MRVEFDCDLLKFSPKGFESMLLKNEDVDGILEFAEGQFLLSCLPNTLLVVKNWSVAHIITDESSRNIGKNMLVTMPGFCVDDFPFVLSSGRNSFNLINVITGQQ